MSKITFRKESGFQETGDPQLQSVMLFSDRARAGGGVRQCEKNEKILKTQVVWE